RGQSPLVRPVPSQGETDGDATFGACAPSRPRARLSPTRALRRAARETGSARRGNASLRTWGPRNGPQPPNARAAPEEPVAPLDLHEFVRGEAAAQRVLGDHARLDELHEVIRAAGLPADARQLASPERLATDARAGGGAVDIEVADAKGRARPGESHRAA